MNRHRFAVAGLLLVVAQVGCTRRNPSPSRVSPVPRDPSYPTKTVFIHGREFWFQPLQSARTPSIWTLQLQGDGWMAALGGCGNGCPVTSIHDGGTTTTMPCVGPDAAHVDGTTIVFGECRLTITTTPGDYFMNDKVVKMYPGLRHSLGPMGLMSSGT